MTRWEMPRSPSSRPLLNARSEALSPRPSFENRRFLMSAKGFFDWRSVPDGKAPLWMCREDECPLAFAELYGYGAGTIIKTDSNSLMRPIYGGRPTILSPDEYAPYLCHREMCGL